MSTPDWLNWSPTTGEIIRHSKETGVSKGTKGSFDTFDTPVSGESKIIRGASESCPYQLPEGVALVRYQRKSPPIAIMVCSVVTDPDKFIKYALAELAARLHRPVQIKAGDSVFELLAKLSDCGLELRLEWPKVQ